MGKFVKLLAALFCLAMPAATGHAALSIKSELSDKAEALLQSDQFVVLDRMASTLQRQHAVFPGGNPQIHTFYRGLGEISEGSCGCSRGTIPFAVKRQAVEKWLAANPKSSPARVVAAMLWINYAWAARGGDYASLVSSKQWQDYHDRLKTAAAYVAQVNPKEELFVLYERMYLGEITPSPRDTIMTAYRTAVAADPAWFPIYARAADMLKQKWYGKPGELARFAHSLLQTPGGDTGQTAYAEIATAFVDGIAYNDGFEAVGGDWPALKRVYAAKEKRYGLSEDDASALLQYAALFHDGDAAATAVRQLRQYADRGYSSDMNTLGWAYMYGKGVPAQPDLGLSWYRKAAVNGNVTSQYQLGWIFERTPGGGQEALKWYGLAAAQGYAVAVNNMGFMYENGNGVMQDYPKAAKLYQDAAGKGDHRAEYHLGTLYARGLGVAKDETRALQWITKAAEAGDADARAWLRDRADVLRQLGNTL